MVWDELAFGDFPGDGVAGMRRVLAEPFEVRWARRMASDLVTTETSEQLAQRVTRLQSARDRIEAQSGHQEVPQEIRMLIVEMASAAPADASSVRERLRDPQTVLAFLTFLVTILQVILAMRPPEPRAVARPIAPAEARRVVDEAVRQLETERSAGRDQPERRDEPPRAP